MDDTGGNDIWGLVMEKWGVRRVASLGDELKTWRTRRELSLRALANRVHCDHTQLWKIERGKAVLSRDLAVTCDRELEAGGALVAAWAAAQGSVRPAQLPVAPARVVGREAEVAALMDGTQDRPHGAPRVVAIDGPAGVGKTTLALWWAHQIADEYVDGQLYVDLGGFAPTGQQVAVDAVLEGFLTAMGASSIPNTTRERAALYRSLLAKRRVLVVLDNVAEFGDIEQLLPASAGCGLIVTSRRALAGLVARVGATRVTVRPLDERASIRIVRDVIGPRADTEEEAVATLPQLCGHLPLALRAAAEQIAMYPRRAVADLVDELREDEHRLDAFEMVDLRAVFSWSYRWVGDDAARLFRLIGLHRGPHLSVAAAAALVGISRPQARRLLHRLASVHLIEIDSNDMIRLHELVRAYACELAATHDGEDECCAAIQRLAGWYVGATHAAKARLVHQPAEPTDWLWVMVDVESVIFANDITARAWWNAEWDNFGPVTALAMGNGAADTAQQLMTEVVETGTQALWDDGADDLRGVQPMWPTDTRRQYPTSNEVDGDDLPHREASNIAEEDTPGHRRARSTDRSASRSGTGPSRDPLSLDGPPHAIPRVSAERVGNNDGRAWTNEGRMSPQDNETTVPAARSEAMPRHQFSGQLSLEG